MYLPERFQIQDEARVLEVIRGSPLATLVCVQNGSAVINHIPLVLQKEKLIGHMAKANPMWRGLNEENVTAVFHGPNSYITPVWYPEDDVPTWNYAVVHVHGRCRILESYPDLLACLQALSEKMNEKAVRPWKFWLPEDLRGADVLTRKIVGFEIEIERIESKFKLSQNRSAEEVKGAIQGLETERTDDQSHAVARLMREISLRT